MFLAAGTRTLADLGLLSAVPAAFLAAASAAGAVVVDGARS
ncbi:hypothetical protein [Spirillospora sp. NPDC047279]